METTKTHLPPQNLEAESAIIGLYIKIAIEGTLPHMLKFVYDNVDIFYSSENQRIITDMKSLLDREYEAEYEAEFKEFISKREIREYIKHMESVEGLFKIQIKPYEIELILNEKIKELKQLSLKRELLSIAYDIQKLAYDENICFSEAIQFSSEKILKLYGRKKEI